MKRRTFILLSEHRTKGSAERMIKKMKNKGKHTRLKKGTRPYRWKVYIK